LVQRNTTVEVNGKRFDVKISVPEATAVVAAAGREPAAKKPARVAASGAAASGGSGDVTAPMQGTIVKSAPAFLARGTCCRNGCGHCPYPAEPRSR
jgi:acetyl-CoA/propionyl-CoA carboxylase, biotin carboxylase, biotin carboxyl carrier protein